MNRLVECVPNFSEGRRPEVIDAIVSAITSVGDVYLLGREMDSDHNRAVITIVGSPESIGEAAIRAVGAAAKLIDLTRHQGEHPRIGAADVVPFIPIRGVTIEQCVAIATHTARQISERFQIPVYLYESAATRPDRINLERIRRGQFEGLRDEIGSDPDRKPDFGPARIHPTAGATLTGPDTGVEASDADASVRNRFRTLVASRAATVAPSRRPSTMGLGGSAVNPLLAISTENVAPKPSA